MDVIQTTKICAADLEKQGKFSSTDSLRKYKKIILKGIKKKHKNNLSIAELKAIADVKQSKYIRIYLFDKSSEFAIIKEEDMIRKMEGK